MIQINNLTYRYEGNRTAALDNIRLQIGHNSLFGLLGPNGAGKTTLLALIAGLLHCRQDKIFIDRLDTANRHAHRRARMALVPQEYAFYQTLSVQDNLQFFARMQNIEGHDLDKQVNYALQTTELSEYIKVSAARLSGGLKRRLNLAIGLLNQPQLLLLDEPTVGIDPHSRHFILETIRELNRQGTTIVYTSHYMEEVENLCEDIAIIDHGKVLLQGRLSDLLAQHQRQHLEVEFTHPVTRDRLQNLGIRHIGQWQPYCIEINVEEPSELGYTIARLEKEGIRRIKYGDYRLENLFLDLTHRSLRD